MHRECFLSIKFVSWTEIFVTFMDFWQTQGIMLAHNLAHFPPVPDDPFSVTITAASKKSCMHSPIMYQTDLLISKRKRSARAMRSISCLCSSNRSVSLFSGTNFSSLSERHKPNTEMWDPRKMRGRQRGTNKPWWRERALRFLCYHWEALYWLSRVTITSKKCSCVYKTDLF